MTFGILALGFPILQVLQPLGAHRLTFPYLNAFLRWRLASWLWGSLFRRLVPCFASFAGFAAFGGSQSHFLPYLNAFLRWRLASWLWGSLFRRLVPCFAGFASFAGFAAFGSPQSHFLPYLNAFLRWRLASWLWGSLFRRFCSLWGLTVSLSSLS